MKTRKKYIIVYFLINISFFFTVTNCDNGLNQNNNKNHTSLVSDFDISGIGSFTYNGSPKTVIVTAKEGKTSGVITVKYNNYRNDPRIGQFQENPFPLL